MRKNERHTSVTTAMPSDVKKIVSALT